MTISLCSSSWLKSHPAEEKSSLKGAWSGSREQFLHCGLRKFRYSKSSVYRWYTQFDRRRFVYDTWDNGSRLGRIMVECTLFMTHCLRLNLQLHSISLVRTCRISSFCTVAWQLSRLLLTRRIARSLGDSWASYQVSHATVEACSKVKYIISRQQIASRREIAIAFIFSSVVTNTHKQYLNKMPNTGLK